MDINQAFKSTFILLFGQCNVELDELAEYLKRWHPNVQEKRSVSGNSIGVGATLYPKNANFLSYDEIDFSKQYSGLNINEIKDIDSVKEAIGDRVHYVGSKILGNSGEIENGDDIFDSFYVKNSCNIRASKYVAYSSFVRDNSEFVFGGNWFLRSKHLIRCLGADNINRCFETYYSTNCADLFFCYGCHGCANAMFSFNLRSKRYAIGNLELPKDKYAQIRQKLVEESREYIEKNKSFYSIFSWPNPSNELRKRVKIPEKKKSETNFELIDDAFRTTCRVVFGQEIGSLLELEKYLLEKQEPVEEADTYFGNKTYYSNYSFFGYIPKKRMLSLEEAEEMAKQAIEVNGGDDLESIMKKIEKIAFYRVDLNEGKNENNIFTHVVYHGSHSYKVEDITFAKYCACSTMALNCEYVFGSYWSIYSKFCIRCYNSVNLTRCFELSECSNCADSLFCYNCEDLNNCMFCFNVKGKRYAIGNVEIGKENYLKIKKIILKEIVQKLQTKKRLEQNIFNLTS